MNSEVCTKEQLIALAMGIADFTGDENVDEFNVMVAAARLQNYSRDSSLPSRMLKATPIIAKVCDVAFEESSRRYLITFIAKNSDEEEHIRTDRLDGGCGEQISAMVNDCVGKHCVIYKLLEKQGAKGGRDVRVAPYIKALD